MRPSFLLQIVSLSGEVFPVLKVNSVAYKVSIFFARNFFFSFPVIFRENLTV